MFRVKVGVRVRVGVGIRVKMIEKIDKKTNQNPNLFYFLGVKLGLW